MLRKILFISSVTLLFLTIPHPALADVSAQLKQAAGYKDNRQYQQAEAIYQQIITDFPDTNDALEAQKQLTVVYIAWDRQPQAEAAYQQLLANYSEDKRLAEAVRSIGDAYNDSGRYKKAIELYQYVVDNWPQHEH